MGDMTFAACNHEISSRLDLSTSIVLKQWHQASGRHGRRHGGSGSFTEGGGEIHDVDEVFNDSSFIHCVRPAYRKRHFTADVIEVALGPRHARNTVIATDNEQRTVEFIDSFQLLYEDTESVVHGQAFA